MPAFCKPPKTDNANQANISALTCVLTLSKASSMVAARRAETNERAGRNQHGGRRWGAIAQTRETIVLQKRQKHCGSKHQQTIKATRRKFMYSLGHYTGGRCMLYRGTSRKSYLYRWRVRSFLVVMGASIHFRRLQAIHAQSREPFLHRALALPHR